jgi:hypothetical protein
MSAGEGPVLVGAHLEEVIRQLEETASARSDALGVTLSACARRLRVALLLGRRLRNTALTTRLLTTPLR